MRRLAVMVLAFACAGCGADAPAPEDDAFSKAPAPELPERYHGESFEHWLQAAKSPVAAVRAEAAWGLGELGTGKAGAAEALGRLLEDPSADVRVGALAAFQRLGAVPASMADRVLGAAHGVESAPTALVAALEPLLATESLAQVLGASPVESASFRGAARLAPARGASMVAALRPLLGPGVDPARQQVACEVLGAIGGDAAPAIPALIRLLPSKAPVGPAAAGALGKVGAPAKPALEAFLDSDTARRDARAALLARLALSRIR